MKILLIKGQSRYGALRLYIDEFAGCFSQLGDQVFVVDSLEKGAEDTLKALLEKEKHFDYLVSCNAMFTELFTTQLNECIDHFASYVTDHPSSHFARLLRANDNCMFFLIDRNHKKFVDRYYKNIKQSYFIPLSGKNYSERVLFKDKISRIVFTGSYAKPIKIYEENTRNLPENMIGFVDMIINHIISNPWKTVEEGVNAVLQSLEVAGDDMVLFRMCIQLSWINSFLEMYFRDAVVRKIVESGIELHIFGEGWKDFESTGFGNFIFHDYTKEDSLEFVANSTISLNIMPWFRAGFQERIANAMLNGTLSITDNTEYIESEFTDGENIVTFSLSNLDELPEKIRFYLDNKEVAETVANNGYELANSEHTWMNRVKLMRKKMNAED